MACLQRLVIITIVFVIITTRLLFRDTGVWMMGYTTTDINNCWTGSVIGPILFILYTADLVALIESLGLSPHLYAETPRFTAPVHHHTSTCFYQKSPTASPLSLTGCGPTAYNSTTKRGVPVVHNGPSPTSSAHCWSYHRLF